MLPDYLRRKDVTELRGTYSVIFVLLIYALGICAVLARRSNKPIGRAVSMLELALIPPVMGNLLIVGSGERYIALIGCYVYFIGMDLVLYALVRFTEAYCKGTGNGQKRPTVVYAALLLDSVQMICNLFIGHAFSIEAIDVEGTPYYRLVPHLGQIVHRIVDYAVFIAILLIFLVISVKTTKIYRERFSAILVAMTAVGMLQTYYIFSRSPIDRSMVGYGIFGLLIFYLSLIYRPLRLLDRMLSGITSEMSEAIYVFDPTGNCIWANTRGCELAEVTDDNYDGVKDQLIELFGDPSQSSEQSAVQRSIQTENGIRYYRLEENKVHDEKKHLTGSYLFIRDITAERERVKQELYNAMHDKLTGLYTRSHLYARIEETLTADPHTQYLIVFLDVKNFKIVNDIFGTDFGDYALCCIAEWIRSHACEKCIYGRLAGDTFGLCVPIYRFNRRMLEAELANFRVARGKVDYPVLLHLGVYEVTPDTKDVSVMFDRAHLSLSVITDEYHTHIAFYDDRIREQLLWNQKISSQLHEAIRTKQLRPYLQPIADENGKVVGAEALARWIHPEYGFMAPGQFIPVFEKNGMIVEVDRHMWRCACETLSRWQKAGMNLFISVNISPKDFYFVDVIGEIQHLVHEYGVYPARLRIEITETVMMSDSDNRIRIIEEFRKAGFIVEMDDFGSGYSSLNLLKDMPVDVLKIDMKFLGETKELEKAHTIVKNIINLSQELGIVSLTEGIENEGQYAALSRMGCKLFQGYYFAKPMPVEEFEQFAKIGQPRACGITHISEREPVRAEPD